VLKDVWGTESKSIEDTSSVYEGEYSDRQGHCRNPYSMTCKICRSYGFVVNFI